MRVDWMVCICVCLIISLNLLLHEQKLSVNCSRHKENFFVLLISFFYAANNSLGKATCERTSTGIKPSSYSVRNFKEVERGVHIS